MASAMAPRSVCLSVPACPPPSCSFVFDFESGGVAASSSALRTTLRPITFSNSASISSAAALRFRFLCPRGGEDSPTTSSSIFSCSLFVRTTTADVAVLFGLVLLPDDEPDDGVACCRRHSSGLRWSSDNPSPRVKNLACCELAKRATCGSSARASFS